VSARTPGENDTPSGLAVDLADHLRPGVPRERDGALDPGAHGHRPSVQPPGPAAADRRAPGRPTPVFGTAQPLRGVSGALRRLAYRVPEHHTARWGLLLVADRVDVLEHRLARALWLLPVGAGLALGFATVTRALRHRR
jgi:hypothetical protein